VVLLSMLEEWHAVYFLLLLKRWNEQQMNYIRETVLLHFRDNNLNLLLMRDNFTPFER
jgi:hypothetical protein